MTWYLMLKLFILFGAVSFVSMIFTLTAVRVAIEHYFKTKNIDIMSTLLGGLDLGEKRGTQEDKTRSK
jgi:hypothetical protein